MEALRDGIEAGDLREVDVARTATTLWAAWNGVISLLWRQDRLGETPDDVAALLDRAVDLVLDGLRRPDEGHPPGVAAR